MQVDDAVGLEELAKEPVVEPEGDGRELKGKRNY
jgi:hypothetical protein